VEDIAEKFVKIIDTVEPDAELAALYEERYQKFKRIYPALRPVYSEIYGA
jgi:xylulokinase